MEVVLFIMLAILTVKCIGYWIGILTLVRWMEINKMPQPSDEEKRMLVRWVTSNIFKDLKKF